jgi:hypothetical protein
MTHHDTPTQPLSELRHLDTLARPGEMHAYIVIAINGAGWESEPSPRSTSAKKWPARTR